MEALHNEGGHSPEHHTVALEKVQRTSQTRPQKQKVASLQKVPSSGPRDEVSPLEATMIPESASEAALPSGRDRRHQQYLPHEFQV